MSWLFCRPKYKVIMFSLSFMPPIKVPLLLVFTPSPRRWLTGFMSCLAWMRFIFKMVYEFVFNCTLIETLEAWQSVITSISFCTRIARVRWLFYCVHMIWSSPLSWFYGKTGFTTETKLIIAAKCLKRDEFTRRMACLLAVSRGISIACMAIYSLSFTLCAELQQSLPKCRISR